MVQVALGGCMVSLHSWNFLKPQTSEPSGLISEIIQLSEGCWTRDLKGLFNLVMLALCQMYFIYYVFLS